MPNELNGHQTLTPFWHQLKDEQIFCGFNVFKKKGSDKPTKQPVGVDGKPGVSAQDALSRCGTYDQMSKVKYDFLGVSLMRPITIDNKYLVCVDLDWKNDPHGIPMPEQVELSNKLKALGAAYEESHSGDGAHFFVLCKEENIPWDVKLGEYCEIEIFSGREGAKQISNVMLTDKHISGGLIEVNLRELMPYSIPPVVEVAKVVEGDGDPFGMTNEQIEECLAAIDPNCSNDEWLSVLMAVHTETNGEGFDLVHNWSMQAGPDKYKGEADCATRWASLGKRTTGKKITGRTLLKMAADNGAVVSVNDVKPEDFEVLPALVLPKSGLTPPSFTRDRQGRIEATLNNVLQGLRYTPFSGVDIRYDEFKDEIVIDPDGNGQWRQFTDVDYVDLRHLFERREFKLITKDMMRDCVLKVADDHRFDTAIEWIDGLVWDGVPRVAKFLSKYFGVEDSVYHSAVSMYWLTAHAGRILAPGIQADMIPILVGSQGMRKSSAVKALVPSMEHFVEFSFTEKEDDLSRKLRGALIGEIGELRGLHTRDLETIKQLVTRTHEKWIPKFKEFSTTFPRRCVLVGTTNQEEFLADETGNRRFLPIVVGENLIDTDGIIADREQLWAEAAVLFRAKGIAFSDAESLAKEVHKDHIIKDAWLEPVRNWYFNPSGFGDVKSDLENRGRVTTHDALVGVFQFSGDKLHHGNITRMGRVLQQIGCTRTRIRVDGARQYVFEYLQEDLF